MFRSTIEALSVPKTHSFYLEIPSASGFVFRKNVPVAFYGSFKNDLIILVDASGFHCPRLLALPFGGMIE